MFFQSTKKTLQININLRHIISTKILSSKILITWIFLLSHTNFPLLFKQLFIDTSVISIYADWIISRCLENSRNFIIGLCILYKKHSSTVQDFVFSTFPLQWTIYRYTLFFYLHHTFKKSVVVLLVCSWDELL